MLSTNVCVRTCASSLYVYYVLNGWGSMLACTCSCMCGHICVYVFGAFVYFCRGLRRVLVWIKQLSVPLVSVCECVCTCKCVCEFAFVCVFVLTSVCRVMMLHLKGAVINEMNKTPWQQLDYTVEIKESPDFHTFTRSWCELGDLLLPKKEEKCKTFFLIPQRIPEGKHLCR